MRIRPAKPDDSEAIHAVHNASVRRTAALDYGSEQIEAWIGHLEPIDYRQTILRGQESIFVAFNSTETLIGFSSIVKNEIRSVYVSPLHLREGVGSALLLEVEREATRNQHVEVHLTSSISASAFYLARGYRAYRETTLELTGGIRLPCIRMLKTLKKKL